ncbi:Calmodulin and related proteins (EF-Hand superfamily) [Plasmopara halstedii]|uniref:Calmodulin and related proteins (EF-Hand superfamily) n=1 Tax=Plasmopara halstedii TaxID=4781 RepID=A0A0P1AAH8_PLAHL|nr:Calmodulin and related proteins (EF-Hand superfamily) [Plasmopara halstedii]CEG37605.1 Calmodulin and related proteins (EF-Hand superfamily) [Plasmopara halstedii]|eukprot:XP_024573974.1 Calmodulin and related proteins (EF-Hand superfamily) [Plasmopara halstedii]
MSGTNSTELIADDFNELRAVFNVYDENESGSISTLHIPELLEKLGRDASEELLNELDDCTDNSGVVSFQDLASLLRSNALRQREKEQALTKEYRLKCEGDGNYLEAQRADSQLTTLRQKEFKRQSKALKVRQIAERQDVQMAHVMQLNDFNRQMTERHAADLVAYQEKLQHAQQKSYTEAQKMKQLADDVEADERSKLSDELLVVFARKETKLRQQQQAEMKALLKRIDGRRNEHLKQRTLDSKRLMQRNRNVQSVLESKQVAEATRKMQDIKMSLAPKERTVSRGALNVIPPQARGSRIKKVALSPPEHSSTSPVI